MNGRWNGSSKLWLIGLLCACSAEPSGTDPGAIPVVPGELEQGVRVAVPVPEGVTELTEQLAAARQQTADEVRRGHAVEFQGALAYAPLEAEHLGDMARLIPQEQLDRASGQLSQNGFAILDGMLFGSFAQGYSEIYRADLPVFVSADMVLEAIYRSHDRILQQLEKTTLRPRLIDLLKKIRGSLVDSAPSLPPEVASDLNLYLGVALSLLAGEADAREPQEVKDFVRDALAAAGERERILFGVARNLDFSQFKPRGHYAGDKELEGYFRAMIWLGRIDFRLLETGVDGSQVLRRRQVESVVALRHLLGKAAFAEYGAIDAAITAFAGEHDYMTLPEVDDLLTALGAQDGLAGIDDETLAEAIVAGQFGQQRIASHVMRRAAGAGTFPLNASFALFGQRYTVDSEVLSNVVYDRVPTRVVPNPLDIAFAALGNDQALTLLGQELDDEAEYPGALSAMRLLVDAHPQQYWQGSLYTNWMSALRTLSPSATPASDLPGPARTEAWGRRLLSTQLSSWAELRHNNVLYLKESYTSSAACEYPDAYVDPYPDFFDAVVHFGERAQELLSGLEFQPEFAAEVQRYFANVVRINGRLANMARAQRSGEPHSAEDVAFINQAVQTSVNCDGTILGHTGWYSELHWDPRQAVEVDPVITDVHTDIGGDLPVARPPTVLHVGTGMPQLMLLTVDSCQGPRAYAGVVSSYHEDLEAGLTRLTDQEWKQRVYRGVPPVPWMEPLLVK